MNLELLRREATARRRVTTLTLARTSAAAGDAGDAGDEALRLARAELLEIQRTIRSQDPAYAAVRGVAPADLEDAAALLDDETAAVAYGVTEERVLVFVITAYRFWSAHDNTTRADLTSLVEQYRSHMDRFGARSRDIVAELEHPVVDGELEGVRSLASRLYDILVRPVAEHLAGKRRLVLIPHDCLHNLPFQALFDGEQHLLERYTLSYAPSISLWDLCSQRQRQSRGRVIILGNPDLGDPKLDLPFAEEEAIAIASLFRTRAEVGAKATLSVLERGWARADLIHLACHAEWNRAQPEFSALLLSPSEGKSGRLEVHELFGLSEELPLSQVTLSACQTALGAGRDLTGLTAGFIYAGSPAVVASLWRVDDFSTGALMTAFYSNLESSDRASALREAQLELLRSREHSHPYFWAPFILTGVGSRIDAEPVQRPSAFHFTRRWTFRAHDGYLIRPSDGPEVVLATWLEREDWPGREQAIWAISKAERKLLWRHEVSRAATAFQFVAGLAHINGVSATQALRIADGAPVWERETETSLTQSLRFSGGLLYTGGHAQVVRALDPATGATAWEARLPRPGSGGFAVGGGRVFAGSNDHFVYAFDARDGRRLWRQELGWTDWSSGPAWVGKSLLHTSVGTFDVTTGHHDRDARISEVRVSDEALDLTSIDDIPPGHELDLAQIDLRVDSDATFVSEPGDRASHLLLFDSATGRLLRRFRVGRRRLTGISTRRRQRRRGRRRRGAARLLVSRDRRGGLPSMGVEEGLRFDFHLAPAPRLLWSRQVGSSERDARPAVHEGRIYAWDRDGTLVVLNLESGAELGRHHVLDEITACTPALGEDVVYLSAHRKDGGGESLCAHDLKSDRTLWSVPSPRGWLAPITDGQMVWARTPEGMVCALDARDGATRWAHHLRRGVFQSPLVFAENVVLAGGMGPAGFELEGYLTALDAGTGDVRWQYLTVGLVPRAPAANADRVFVGEGGKGRGLHCLSVKPRSRSGERRWRQDSHSPADEGVAAGGTVYWGSEDGQFYAFEEESGRALWRFRAGEGAAADSPPCTFGSWVFMSSRDGHL